MQAEERKLKGLEGGKRANKMETCSPEECD